MDSSVRVVTQLATWGAVLIVINLLSEGLCAVSDYRYINCFADQVSDPDLTGKLINYDTLDFENCAEMCRGDGSPYFGIKEARKCLCGSNYGKHGVTNTCNYTCNSNIKCGGVTSNDIFISIKTDTATTNGREDSIYTDALTYADASSICTQNNGFILSVTDATTWANTKSSLAGAAVSSGKVWQGLKKLGPTQLQSGQSAYMWTDIELPAFTTSSLWKAGETWANDCVVIDIDTSEWETTSCTAQHPFICYQIPPPDPSPTSDGDGGSTGDSGEDDTFDASKLSLYIVLPLFGLCYGGSCIMYCTHKLYKSFKRKKRQKMLLSRMDDMPDRGTPGMGTEYEPHNKPKYEPPLKPSSGRPFSAGKRAAVHPIVGPPPIQNGYFTDKPPPKEPGRGSRTPVENIRIDSSPRGEPEGEQANEEHKDDPKLVPNTARDVQIDMPPPLNTEPEHPEPERESEPVDRNSPSSVGPTPPPVVSANAIGNAAAAVDAFRGPARPGASSAKTKSEFRRQKLLEKALKEARERRRAEGTPVPDVPPVISPPNENQWAKPVKKRNKSPKYGDETDSGDSTVNLLSDNERGRSADPDIDRDPTTMSINEILKMKVAMRQSKRKKKIQSA